MNLTELTALINSKIRTKTPKVIKTEHADVEQALLNRMLPVEKGYSKNDTDVFMANDIFESVNFPNIFLFSLLKNVGGIVFGRINIAFNTGHANIPANSVLAILKPEFRPSFLAQMPLDSNSGVDATNYLFIYPNGEIKNAITIIPAKGYNFINSYYFTNP